MKYDLRARPSPVRSDLKQDDIREEIINRRHGVAYRSAVGNLLLRLALIFAMLSACTQRQEPITYLPPPPDAAIRAHLPPKLEGSTPPSADTSVQTYMGLVSAILAKELSTLFDLPASSQMAVPSYQDDQLLGVLDSLTNDVIIPAVFDVLDHGQKDVAILADISLSRRSDFYHVIIDTAVARALQAASGRMGLYEDYLTYLAEREPDGWSDADDFVLWSGVKASEWQASIIDHSRGTRHPFFLLGTRTATHLHTHIFSMIGYSVASSFAETLVDDDSAGLSSDRRQYHARIDNLAAELMARAGLPLLGVDALFAVTADQAEDRGTQFCRRWRFFQRSMELYTGRSADPRFALANDDDIASGLRERKREQEAAINRRLATFISNRSERVSYVGFSRDQLSSLVDEPENGCGRAQLVASIIDDDVKDGRVTAISPVAATAVAEVASARPWESLCNGVLAERKLPDDNDTRVALCILVGKMLPPKETLALLGDIARGRETIAGLSALYVGLGIVRNEAATFSIGQRDAIDTAIATLGARLSRLTQ